MIRSQRRFSAMAFLIAVAVFASTAPRSCEAQQAGGPDPYTDLSQYLLVGNQPVPRASSGTMTSPALSSSASQIGQNNNATAVLAGSGNLTVQTQNGVGNSSSLNLDGTQNAVTTTQIGNANTTTIAVVGSSNTISNLQQGDGLSYHLQVTGTAPPISVTQVGVRGR